MKIEIEVRGQSMQPELCNGDYIVFDTDIIPQDKDNVVALLDGGLYCKQYRVINGETYLDSVNIDYEPILINPNVNFDILGVIVGVRRFCNKHLETIDYYNFIKHLNNCLLIEENKMFVTYLTREYFFSDYYREAKI